MTPEQAIEEADKGALRPVYLVVGEERFLVDRVVSSLRKAALVGGVPGLSDESFVAPEASAQAVVASAKSLPMMARRKVVVVRGLERWEKRGGDDEGGEAESPGVHAAPLDVFADYAKHPVDSTVLVLVADKLHAQRKLVTHAKKAGFLVDCAPLQRRALPGFIARWAKERGHPMDPSVAELLAETAGTDLGVVTDALERLSLFVGPGGAIDEDAVEQLVTRVKQRTVWELLDALGARRTPDVLRVLADVYEAREGGLKLLGLVWWSVRQLVKFESALAEGESAQEAARRAGVPPFRAGDVARTLRSLPPGTLPRWLSLLADADLALKSSRRPPLAILEALFLEMCGR